jgi:peroxiredoxin
MSSTGNVAVDLDKSYHYLDSLNMSFEENTLKDILSKKDYTIVYFYPLDFTPNCTIQAIDFSTMLEDFNKK